MSPPDGALLLTGATGFLGQELLARLLDDDGRRRPIVALVRAQDDDAAQARVDDVVRALGHPADGRVRAIAADLTAPGLGVSPTAQGYLWDTGVTTVLHCAASVSFTLPLAEARRVNVEGTRRMLELARRLPGLERFAYVSTAYVAGRHRGVFGADDLDRGQAFRNTYEQSKHEAEALVRAAGLDVPVQVFRPSIVVGDQHTGWTTSFNVLYQPLRAFSRGHFTVLPGRSRAPADIVPVDYVADAIAALLTVPFTSPATYPLVAGRQAATVGEVVALAAGHLGLPAPRVVAPALFAVLAPLLRRLTSPAARAVLDQSAVYFPYFAVATRFDDQPTRALLEPLGLRVPELASYLPGLIDFAQDARWGKRLPQRPRRGVPARA